MKRNKTALGPFIFDWVFFKTGDKFSLKTTDDISNESEVDFIGVVVKGEILVSGPSTRKLMRGGDTSDSDFLFKKIGNYTFEAAVESEYVFITRRNKGLRNRNFEHQWIISKRLIKSVIEQRSVFGLLSGSIVLQNGRTINAPFFIRALSRDVFFTPLTPVIAVKLKAL